MQNELQLFSYEEDPVRVVMLGDPPTPWWVAKDVCDILGYSNSRKALADHLDDDEKGVTICYTPGGEQNMNVINESGLYCLILRSNMPKAKEFRKWVTTTVLPQVMRKGLPEQSEPKVLPSGVMEGARMIFEVAGIKDNQLSIALDKIYTSYTGQSALKIGEVTLVAPTNNQLFNPTDIGKHFGVSNRKINELLVRENYQRRLPNGKHEPLELGEPYAVMLDTGKHHSDGTPVRQLKWDSGIIDELEQFFPQLPF